MGFRFVAALALILTLFTTLEAQEKITKLELKTVPTDRRIRPFETATVQVIITGEVIDKNGDKKPARLKKNGTSFRITDQGGGWLSKPFLNQEGDEAIQSAFSLASRIALNRDDMLGNAQDFVFQDTVLYTAPEKTGKYTIEASLGGQSAKTTIEVDAKAKSYKVPERTSFPSENNRDPYLALVQHYAPYVAQETWFTPKADFLSRFDYDGDWKGSNNWDDLDTGSSQAFVHYAVMETETHWFLIYNFFHPRDYSDKCLAGTCHENDNEGMIMTIAKDGSAYGRPAAVETLAHNNIYSFTADRRIKNGVHDIDGGIEWVNQSHPVIFVESGGHGVFGSEASHARFRLNSGFTAGTGVTYTYKGQAERPKHANDREVGYDLISIEDAWWKKAGPSWSENTFDDFFPYQPLGGRPRTQLAQIPGAFWGRKEASNKARPFWGWFDNLTSKKKILAQGQWALDPAYSVSMDLRFPSVEPFSLNYVHNPYLKVEGSPVSQTPLPAASINSINTPEALNSSQASSPAPASTESGTFDLQSAHAKDWKPKSKEGRLDLRLHVDGSINLFIQGDRIRYKVTNGRPPRDDGSVFTQPIPSAPLKTFEVDKKDGRGKVVVVEEPTTNNNFTASIQIDDPKGGEGKYKVEVKWKRK